MKTFIRIVVALGILCLVLVLASYLLPGSYRVERAIEIDAPAPVVFTYVGDLRKWAEWTPWSEMDPKMRTTYSDPTVGKGAWQEWDGPEVGKGKLTITSYEPPGRLEYDLYFPEYEANSVGEVRIQPLPGQEGRVRVTWSDAGKLGMSPIMRWFGLFFDRLIGPDFEKGLAKLKKLTETPALPAGSS